MYLTTKEAEAKYLVSRHKIVQFAEAGKLPESFQTKGGHWRVWELDLKRVLDIREDV